MTLFEKWALRNPLTEQIAPDVSAPPPWQSAGIDMERGLGSEEETRRFGAARGDRTSAHNEQLDEPVIEGDEALVPDRGGRRRLPAYDVSDLPNVAVTLHGIGHGGEAVGRIDGQVAFVANALPGETVHVRVLEKRAAFIRGVALAIETPSPDRIDPPCHLYGECGGCHWQHATYEAQLAFKTQVLRDQLVRLGGIADPPITAPIASPLVWRYRNTIQVVPAVDVDGNRTVNFQEAQAHGLVHVDQCLIASADLNRALEALPWATVPIDTWTRLSGIVLRYAPPIAGMPSVVTRLRELTPKPERGRPGVPGPVRDEQGVGHGLQVTFVCRAPIGRRDLRPFIQAAPGVFPDLAGVLVARDRGHHGTLLWGCPTLAYEMGNQIVGVPAGAFFQVNLGASALLVKRVRDWLAPTPESQVIDAYAGVGVFALELASIAGAVVAIESDDTAAGGAYDNVVALGHTNVNIFHEPVEEALPRLARGEAIAERLLILDPPRRGVAPEVIDALADLAPSRIVYVSCEPATLARDLRRIVETGYRVTRTGIIDLFPQTYHLESVTLLERL